MTDSAPHPDEDQKQEKHLARRGLPVPECNAHERGEQYEQAEGQNDRCREPLHVRLLRLGHAQDSGGYVFLGPTRANANALATSAADREGMPKPSRAVRMGSA